MFFIDARSALLCSRYAREYTLAHTITISLKNYFTLCFYCYNLVATSFNAIKRAISYDASRTKFGTVRKAIVISRRVIYPI